VTRGHTFHSHLATCHPSAMVRKPPVAGVILRQLINNQEKLSLTRKAGRVELGPNDERFRSPKTRFE
jgi:hypothetical protein